MKKLIACAFVLSIAIGAAPGSASASLLDGSFELQGADSMSTTGYCYMFGASPTPACAAGAWSSVSGVFENSGLQGENNGAWPGNPTPDGNYYGFVQGSGSLTQTFSAAATGQFMIDWLESGRTAPTVNGDHSYTVLLDGHQIGSGTTTNDATWYGKSSSSISLVAGNSYTLVFQGILSGGDTSSFIDAVALSAAIPPAVPEPASWAMLVCGMGLIGGAMRRRSAGHAVTA